MRLVLLAVVLLAGCASDPAGVAGPGDAPTGITVTGGLRADPLVRGLDGPTQMVFGPDGRLWVAQLNGGENEQRGQVVAVDPGSGAREVVVDGLDKPTGIAWLDGDLWIATRTALLRAAGDPPGRPATVLADLPSNGRSQGTLTVTPDGTLLYETSGREQRGGGVVDGSGVLWELDPGAPDDARPVATGLRNAYAHVFDGDGALWATEVAEPTGGVTAPDELNRIERGADHGWPACVGVDRAVASFGGDARTCAAATPPVATFDAGATPTSIVVDPFAPPATAGFVVALWNAGEVVGVARDGSGAPRSLITGLARPQHLLVHDGALLVSDHRRGVIYRVVRPTDPTERQDP